MQYNFQAFINGAGHFILAFSAACILLALFKRLYQMATPYDEAKLIADGNMAAAVTLAGAIIGFALPLASALRETGDIVEFAMWAVLAGIIQIVVFAIIRKFIVPDVKERIEQGNIATASYLAATAIGVGLLNAASMTY